LNTHIAMQIASSIPIITALFNALSAPSFSTKYFATIVAISKPITVVSSWKAGWTSNPKCFCAFKMK
jgi:hypothetical protein